MILNLTWAYVIEALASQNLLAKPLANPSYANLGVIEALASTDARRGTC